MIGFDLTFDATDIVAECMKRRLLINATHGHVVRLLPALTITDEQIDEGCADPCGRPTPLPRHASFLKLDSGHATSFYRSMEISPAEACRLIDAFDRDQAATSRQGKRPLPLSGRTLGLLFEKPSLRTRVSFEAAIARLGGNAIFLRGKDVGLGVRESVADFARVLSQYVDVMAVRTFSHATVEELARSATIPVINALSDAAHPCQAMADFMTIEELRGPFKGREARVHRRRQQRREVAGRRLGPARRSHFVLAAPPGYEFPPDFQARFAARFPSVPLVVEHDPQKAVTGRRRRLYRRLGEHGTGARSRRAARDLRPYQVNEATCWPRPPPM